MIIMNFPPFSHKNNKDRKRKQERSIQAEKKKKKVFIVDILMFAMGGLNGCLRISL